MTIRKQINDLTLADLEAFPVWEFALDEEDVEGQDETTVRPYLTRPIDALEGQIIVRARFVLADGSVAAGFMTPGVAVGELSLLQPCIMTEQGQVHFWFGILKPSAEGLVRSYTSLGKTAGEVFPITFAADSDDVKGVVAGIIPGFVGYEDWRSGRLWVVT